MLIFDPIHPDVWTLSERGGDRRQRPLIALSGGAPRCYARPHRVDCDVTPALSLRDPNVPGGPRRDDSYGRILN
jgi:hypothetical protein